MSPDTAEQYLRDLGSILREKALEAKLDREAARDGEDEDLRLGRLMVFYEVLSLMQEQACAFGIDPSAVGLEGFDPDTELL
jgi:hypothetical protein